MFIREYIKKASKKLPWYVQDIGVYWLKFVRFPNIKNPKTLNEKVLYRKNFKMDAPIFSRLADKYRVRDYVSERIGDRYLIPLLFSTPAADELRSFDWREQKVIVKPNHGAGMYKIVASPLSSTELNALVATCQTWLATDFSHVQREIHYRNIPPMILVEKLLGDGNSALTDYKFHLFKNAKGEFDFVLQVINERFTGKLVRHFYLNNFTERFGQAPGADSPVSLDVENLHLALALSKRLGADFSYVRVDWYIHQGCLYFGEITFTPVAGFGTGYGKALDAVMGELWCDWR